jgi:hypothetical protein
MVFLTIGSASCSEDVKIAQYLLTVDTDIENAFACCRPIGFRQVQANRVGAACCQIRRLTDY